MNTEIRTIEELTINAFPALQTEIYDGWILRFSNGYTYRANCICPIYSSENNILDKIHFCENKYISRGLPSIFKITSNTDSELDRTLENNGYRKVKTVNLMYGLIEPMSIGNIEGVEISNHIDDEWLDASIRLSEIKRIDLQEIQCKMLKNIASSLVCVKAKENRLVVGCGLGIIDNGFIGLYNIHVDEKYRRRGIGLNICKAILKFGIENNADKAYLQVHSLNDKAINMYNKLGLQIFYTYWFREKKKDNTMEIIDA
ncbi:GNAT family N-acetyltransferase [Clostridium saccharobutylicum]|uniref:Acetyltransferase YpeA n=1 Tax=Clostridium saccharobutylicum TaxID=169679 RepID=A0A1S8NCW0_CLOSA|nr:GNAT family N-acetyltransferase [Clostridium saccharobutylicum]OOM14213.1 acetyltransferase YpeA [Clostridium saccharobutylicum]